MFHSLVDIMLLASLEYRVYSTSRTPEKYVRRGDILEVVVKYTYLRLEPSGGRYSEIQDGALTILAPSFLAHPIATGGLQKGQLGRIELLVIVFPLPLVSYVTYRSWL